MNGQLEFQGQGEPGISLSVQFLGPFQVRVEGRAIGLLDWDRRNGGNRMVATVFAYLVAHRKEAVPRSEILDTFWRNRDGDTAASGLNRTISALRRVLEPTLRNFGSSSYIFSSRGFFGIDPDLTVWVDAEEFEEVAQRGLSLESQGEHTGAATAYQQARRLYRGDYMEAVPYAKVWCEGHRAYLRQLHTTVLLQLARLAEAEANPILAIECCHTVLAKERCNEEACQRLMGLLLGMGRRSAALGVLESCGAVLKKKYGLEPCKATTELYSRIVASPEGPIRRWGRHRSVG
ncbi:MAG: BTAD domain-containing putative transcriptional regulator [Dehalococcoidia bacterium]|nr:BTAD domain-containing putative transcriptional regulator [Dehalococcoidia bacterium]